MTSEASYQPEGTHPAQGARQTPFTILVLGLVILTMVMLFVGVYAVLSAIPSDIANQAPPLWTRLAWAAMWEVVAALALCGYLVLGLVLCVRPALLVLIAPSSGLSRLSAFRRWPRLTGLTYIWAGGWVFAFALTTLAQAFRAPREPFPPFSNVTFVAIFVVAALPWSTLMLAGRLIRRPQRQHPVAEDGPPSRQSE